MMKTKGQRDLTNYVMINLTSLLKPTQFLILSNCEILGIRGFLGFTSKFALKSFLWLS
jgi:hypothetical protein